MIPTITAFERSPDRGQGLARDMRVRWALEEVGQPYEVRLVSFSAMKEPAHRALHPFGQIPTYEEGDLALFESGAIVLHIAEHHAGLLPDDAKARARAIAWMFAAVNTVEPPILELVIAKFLERGRPNDGLCDAQVESIGHAGRISEPLRLCCPRRSAGRLQACFRRSVGGVHRQACDRLIKDLLRVVDSTTARNRGG
jgi:hypothetical protein